MILFIPYWVSATWGPSFLLLFLLYINNLARTQSPYLSYL